MSTQGTVLFAETMAPTDSTQPGWWLRMDVTVRNNGDQPIEVTDLGITTDDQRARRRTARRRRLSSIPATPS